MSLAPWSFFALCLLGFLSFDLGFLNRRPREMSFREAVGWSGFWIFVSLLFSLGIFLRWGPQKGMEFLTGYVIEKSLSIDNVFVFWMLFTYFRVPQRFQHKVLSWGLVGAIILRALFIMIGIGLLHKFRWISYVFGAGLVLSGVRMAFAQHETAVLKKDSVFIRLLKKIIPVGSDTPEGHFWVREKGKWLATPLFLALLVVEGTDVVFALDSIPAILTISRDPFIVFTSNIFAVLGMRALYFALAGFISKFYFLHFGLSAIIVFVGGKMLLADLLEIPTSVALITTLLILLLSVAFSYFKPAGLKGSSPAR